MDAAETHPAAVAVSGVTQQLGDETQLFWTSVIDPSGTSQGAKSWASNTFRFADEIMGAEDPDKMF
jgi:hypothetical protein